MDQLQKSLQKVSNWPEKGRSGHPGIHTVFHKQIYKLAGVAVAGDTETTRNHIASYAGPKMSWFKTGEAEFSINVQLPI